MSRFLNFLFLWYNFINNNLDPSALLGMTIGKVGMTIGKVGMTIGKVGMTM